MPLNLEPVQSGYNLSVINENFQRIEDTWDEKLDRLVSTQDNYMEQELDMNSNHIINHPAPRNELDLVRLKELEEVAYDLSPRGVIPIQEPRQTGDGSSIIFNAPNDVEVSPATMLVRIDGLVQRPFTDFNVTGINEITFTSAPANGTNVDIMWFEPNILENPDASLRTVVATGSTEARTLADRFADVVNVKDFGAVGDGVTDDTVALRKMVAAINNSNISYVNVDFGNGEYVVKGNEIFAFTRTIQEIRFLNGALIWEPSATADRLFLIDENVQKINCTCDIFTTRQDAANDPRGDIFYFESAVGQFASTNNYFKDMYVSGSAKGSYAPIRNVFNTQGYGLNDQSLVESCRFEAMYTVFRCNNPESVAWVFDRCGFFSIVINARYFWFDTLFSNFSVNNSSFSLVEQTGTNFQRLLYTRANNATYPPSDDCAITFNNCRVESYENAGGTENIRIVDLDFGKVLVNNSQFNLANVVERSWEVYEEASLVATNCTFGDESFITADPTSTSVPFQPACFKLTDCSVVNIPKMTSNGSPLAFELSNKTLESYNTRAFIFDNVVDDITGETLNFNTYNKFTNNSFSETLTLGDYTKEHILQPFCAAESISFNFSKINNVATPYMRVTVSNGNVFPNYTRDLEITAGNFELLPDNFFLFHNFDFNMGNLSRIEFQLLDVSGNPVTTDVDALAKINYVTFDPRMASVNPGIDYAKISSMFGLEPTDPTP